MQMEYKIMPAVKFKQVLNIVPSNFLNAYYLCMVDFQCGWSILHKVTL